MEKARVPAFQPADEARLADTVKDDPPERDKREKGRG